MITEEQLVPYAMDLHFADSAAQALDALYAALEQGSPFDFIITDFQLPDMNGEALAKQIRNDHLLANTTLVLLTSLPRKGDGEQMRQLGFAGYLTKPAAPHDIPDMISKIRRAQSTGQEIGLVTRHSLQNERHDRRDKLKLVKTNILLVEDNAVNQMIATAMLNNYGIIVTPAGNGIEALELFQNNQFDLIFMDCQMPEMDGLEASRRIRDEERRFSRKHTPIIAFTANAMEGDKDKCLAAGMDDYLSKPIQQVDLEDALLQWLGHKVVCPQQNIA